MVSKIMKKMIEYSSGSKHDINHFIKVHSFAKLIGELEGLDLNSQTILEISAIVHDIACPKLRAKYGKADGKLQEIEGTTLARDFLKEFNLDKEVLDRVIYLVGHHHTLDNIDGLDYQILIEADYLVNANESNYSIDNIKNTHDLIFKTDTGKILLRSIYFSDCSYNKTLL